MHDFSTKSANRLFWYTCSFLRLEVVTTSKVIFCCSETCEEVSCPASSKRFFKEWFVGFLRAEGDYFCVMGAAKFVRSACGSSGFILFSDVNSGSAISGGL
ncbi:hypothetical protein CEXT_650291 [Caerostris extrusa]|uniref:Uncharacterized protein n=1 Tax=Caerostris extrusa TaxID=172846 RepID=A0AAV4MY37_CAEEX|nr:hypothetical protein CEXT_650291 [Caerostris extrusa]